MYVIDKNDRYLNIIIGALIFALIASLVKTRLYLVALWETGLQEFLATPPNFLERLLAFLSAPGFCVLYVFFIWFFLWGFKHKLIAFWSLITFFSGEIIFILIRLITYRPLPTGHPQKFINFFIPESPFVFAGHHFLHCLYCCHTSDQINLAKIPSNLLYVSNCGNTTSGRNKVENRLSTGPICQCFAGLSLDADCTTHLH